MTANKEETLIYHLEALRSVLIRIFVALGICFIPLYAIVPYVQDILISIILRDNMIALHFFAPLEIFILQLKIALILDIVLCFPYIAKQLWSFICPALYANERRFIKSIVAASGLLFFIGVTFCLFFFMPLIIRLGLSFADNNIRAIFGIGNVISLALWLSLISGLMFQFPLIAYALIKFHIITYEALKNKRPYIFIGILIVSGILTPPDIISQLLLTFPTYTLFEIGLYYGKKSIN